MFLMSVPPLLSIGLVFQRYSYANITLVSIAGVLWLGIVASAVALYMVNAGITRLQVSNAAITLLMFPAVSALLSYAFLGDFLSPLQLLGAALILTGVLAAHSRILSRGKKPQLAHNSEIMLAKTSEKIEIRS